MAGIFCYTCSCCGELHEGSPSFSFNAPNPYLEQSEEIKKEGKSGSDLCYYKDEDGYHYFVRVIVEIPIIGIEDPFMWGVWVSLSEESYEHYVETFDEPDIDKAYFGWFSNYLPYYDQTYALATEVIPRENGERPYLNIHEVDHEFYDDFKNGITIEKAQKIAEICMHG